MKNQEAKKEAALKEQQDKKFKSQGLEKTKGGYMFPGINPELIDKAMVQAKENKINNVKPPLPKVIGSSMDFEGGISIMFDQEILIPPTIDVKFWNTLIEAQAVSNEDGSIHTVLFGSGRRLLGADNSHGINFRPEVSKFNKTIITIKYNFDDPKKLEVSGKA
jgi:hypothetical protein